MNAQVTISTPIHSSIFCALELSQPEAQAQLNEYSLSAGWNPVLLQARPQGFSLSEQVQSFADQFQQIIHFNAQSQEYSYFKNIPGFPNNLNSLDANTAYWIHLNNTADDFTWQPEVDATSQSAPRTLYEGWNFVGLPLSQATSVEQFQGQHPAIEKIWRFNSERMQWVFWLKNNSEQSTLTTLQPNTLYWVQSSQSQVMHDPNQSLQGEVFSLHSNHLSSIALTLTEDGQVLQNSRYLPYGASANLHPSSIQPYGFTGKEKDLSGLHYFEARYYDSLSARFISTDPLFTEDVNKIVESVIEGNVYQYAGNNPVVFVDLSGRFALNFGGDLDVSALGYGGAAQVKAAISLSKNANTNEYKFQFGFTGAFTAGAQSINGLSGEKDTSETATSVALGLTDTGITAALEVGIYKGNESNPADVDDLSGQFAQSGFAIDKKILTSILPGKIGKALDIVPSPSLSFEGSSGENGIKGFEVGAAFSAGPKALKKVSTTLDGGRGFSDVVFEKTMDLE